MQVRDNLVDNKRGASDMASSWDVWKRRALRHYAEADWMLVRILELEGLQRGDDRFAERGCEILGECAEAVDQQECVTA